MVYKLSDELIAQLQTSQDKTGTVTFNGTGKLDVENKSLVVESINDIPVESADDQSEADDQAEDAAETQGGPMKKMMAGKEKEAPMGIVAMFKKGAGYSEK